MPIKLEQIRVFATVAALGNIGDAARKLGKTQSAISMSLKLTEQMLGAPLFESDRKNALTPFGQFAFDTATYQLASFDRAIDSILAYARNSIGRVSIGCVPSVASTAMPAVLQKFVAQYPDVELDIRDADSLTVEQWVESEQIDLGISLPPREGGPLQFRALYKDRYFLFCRPDNPLNAIDRPLEWTDLSNETLILNAGSDSLRDPHHRTLLDRSRWYVRNVTSLMALVQAGAGVTVLPVYDADRHAPEIVTLPLADPTARQTIGLLTKIGPTRSPAAEAFAELAINELAQHT